MGKVGNADEIILLLLIKTKKALEECTETYIEKRAEALRIRTTKFRFRKCSCFQQSAARAKLFFAVGFEIETTKTNKY